MSCRLKQYLVFALVLLQLFAPLVHAHMGNNTPTLGLHMPGLESYGLTENPSCVRKAKDDWVVEGLLITVDAGIKTPQKGFPAVQDPGLEVSLPERLPTGFISEGGFNFSPQDNALSPQRYLSSNSPRAPPA